MNNPSKELLEKMAEVDCAGKAAAAEVVKINAKPIASFMSLWLSVTCPNHPKSYTEEEKKAHKEFIASQL